MGTYKLCFASHEKTVEKVFLTMKTRLLLIALSFLVATSANCQSSNNEDFESTLGIWYMLFYNKQFSDSQFGVQGDFQD